MHATGHTPFPDECVNCIASSAGPKPSEYPPSYESIEEYARKRWPMAGQIKYRWTGQVMEPNDLIGHYGLDPLNPAGDTYIATGDSGQGT